MKRCQNAYPPISDYALISNRQCAALISRAGSIDWCCMPRIDSDSCFGRLLDWRKGGYCTVFPTGGNVDMRRRYLPGTMVLETCYRSPKAEALVHDYFVRAEDPGTRRREQDRPRLVRLIRGVSGSMELDVHVVPRFDYGEITPHISERCGLYTAVGSNVGLGIGSSAPLHVQRQSDLCGKVIVRAGQCVRLSVNFEPPELLDDSGALASFVAETTDPDFEQTCAAWRA
jgi:GH15 family glucan-1,4-alpha-glucosidase